MSKKILTSLDMGQNELRNVVIENSSSAMQTPIKGQMYYDTTDNKLKYYNNTSWVEAGGGGGSDSIVFVTTQNTYAEVLAAYNAGKEIILEDTAFTDTPVYLYMTKASTQSDASFGFYAWVGGWRVQRSLSASGWGDQKQTKYNRPCVVVTTSATIQTVLDYYDAGYDIMLQYDIDVAANEIGYMPLVYFRENNGAYRFTFFTIFNYQIHKYDLSTSSGWGDRITYMLASKSDTITNEYSVTTIPSAKTIYSGESYMCWTLSQNTTFTLAIRELDSSGKIQEWSLSFVGASTSYTVSFTPPSGCTIKWADTLPSSWVANTYYEFSFKRLHNNVIVGYWRNVS